VAAQVSPVRAGRHAPVAPRPIFSSKARGRRSYQLLVLAVGLP
jgi:hypothetical protein